MEPVHICGARVRYGRVTGAPRRPLLDEAGPQGRGRLTADRRSARLDVAGVGVFLVEDGTLIMVDPAPTCLLRSLDSYLYGTVAALLLGQRGEFALHASTAAIGSSGVAITGDSGAGKSTTVLTLQRWGHRLVTDDVSPIQPRANPPSKEDRHGHPMVSPFGRPVHVWPHTAAAVGVDTGNGTPILPGVEKLALPGPLGDPVPLLAVAELCCSPEPGVTVRRLDGIGVVDLLLRNVYRYPTLYRLWPQEVFAWAAVLSRQLPAWQIIRHAHDWSVTSVAETAVRLATGSAATDGTADHVNVTSGVGRSVAPPRAAASG